MPFVSAVPPLCRYCGKAIGKATRTVWFGEQKDAHTDYATYRMAKPASLEEAQKLVNEKLVHVRWYKPPPVGRFYAGPERVAPAPYIERGGTWDGESYVDEFFCKQGHAQLFGYAAARGGQVMAEYKEAIYKQRAKLKTS